MTQNILITGAAGYIGGSVLAGFISRTNGPIKAANISAAVRTEEQAQALSKLGVNVIQVDLSNKMAVNEAVLSNKIDIVVHTASSMQPPLASHLISALGQRRRLVGKELYIINTSVTTMFSVEGGWPYGEVRDTDPILDKEKEIVESSPYPNPVRETNILVAEEAKARGVTSINLVVPYVYGRGGGEWRKLSVSIPALIRATLKHKTVYKFDTDGAPPAVHISDLTALYILLTETVLQKAPIPSGDKGYYFAMAHRAPWWDVMDRLAKAANARGLVAEPKVQIWPSDEVAAESLGYPLMYLRAMGTSSGNLVPVNAYQLGWQPKWDKERFLASMDDEIQAVQELDTVNTTIFDVLMPSSK